MGIQERKEREKEQRREEIIGAAQKVFFEKGLQPATMDDIADAAEVSKGTLYLYYKSKEDLYLAVVLRGMEILYEMFLKITESDQPAIAKIGLIGDAYLEFFRNHRKYFLMMDFYETPQFHKQVSEEMKQVCSVASQKIWTAFFDTIQRAIDDGMMHPDLKARQVGIIFWSNSNGLMRLGDRDPQHWHELMGIDLDATLKLSNSLLLESMMTDKAKELFKDMLMEKRK
jgi:TetR/AcrR family transcriptional regulator